MCHIGAALFGKFEVFEKTAGGFEEQQDLAARVEEYKPTGLVVADTDCAKSLKQVVKWIGSG